MLPTPRGGERSSFNYKWCHDGANATRVFRSRYAGATVLVGTLGLGAAAPGISAQLMYFNLACRSLLALIAWSAVSVAISAMWMVHTGPKKVASAMVLVVILTAILAILGALGGIGARRARGEQSAQPSEGSPTWPRALDGDVSPELDLTVVVPFYNPGIALGRHIREVAAVLADRGISFEIIAVSDGSTDGSVEALRALCPDTVRCMELPTNNGKGEALRVGLAAGRGRYLGFIDADGDIPAATLGPFVDAIQDGWPDIVTGSKRHPASSVVYPPLRRVYSWGYQQLLRVLFRLNVQDTQTGVKLIRRQVVADTLPYMLEKRFAFDLELFVVARLAGYGHFLELPVRIGERYSSTVSWAAVKGMMLDTAAIFYRLHILHYYEPARARDGKRAPASAAATVDTQTKGGEAS